MLNNTHSERESNIFSEVEVLTYNPDARYSHGLKDIFEIDPTLYPAIYNNYDDEVIRAFNFIQEQGIDIKLFFKGKHGDHNSMFKVKGPRWNWIVKPVIFKNHTFIPFEYLEVIGKLSNDFNICGISYAVPEPQEIKSEIVIKELQQELHTLSDIMIGLLLSIASLFKSLTGVISTSTPAPDTTVNVQQLPDPVLLVKIGSYWLECGRWE